MKIFKGLLFAWCETGTEGVIWTLQEHKYIDANGKNWGYEGLKPLKNKDFLQIFDFNEKLVWKGIVDLDSTVDKHGGFWVHGMPVNMNHDKWADIFHKEKHTGIIERYDMNVATYIYLIVQVFNLERQGFTHDDHEIKEILDQLDPIWYGLNDEDIKLVNEWCEREVGKCLHFKR